jgi:hypothetical protein
MAKKAPAKPAAKRKPRAKKPVDAVVVAPSRPIAWRSWLVSGAKAAALIACGAVAGIWSAGGIEIGPGPRKADAVSAVFDAQEASFRKNLGGLAVALRSGQVKSEAEANTWMDARFGPESEAAWVPLLTEEAAAFGGKEWTAEKHAAHIERYAR